MDRRVEYKPTARQRLRQLPKSQVFRIVTFIEDLATSGDPQDAERLLDPGRPLYRVRVGSHRVVYTVSGPLLTVLAIEPGD